MKISSRLQCSKLKHGSLRLTTIVTPSGTYRVGYYLHPMGIVLVHNESKITHISTCLNGHRYDRARTDHPSDGQISRFCRNLLLEINQPAEENICV